MGDDHGRGIWVPMLILVCFFVGYLFGAAHIKYTFQRDAVEYGYAEYDSQTGDWQWIEHPSATLLRDYMNNKDTGP